MKRNRRHQLIKAHQHVAKLNAAKQRNIEKLAKQKKYKSNKDDPRDFPLIAGYYPQASTKRLDKFYDQAVAPVVKKLRDQDWAQKHKLENERDNRTILKNLDRYDLGDGFNMFMGLVIGYYVKYQQNHTPYVYLLIKNLYTVINKGNSIDRHFASDHIWILVSGYRVILQDNVHLNSKKPKLTIGIGDEISFVAKVNAYRGQREQIEQTKYGLKQIMIIDSGYPYFEMKKLALTDMLGVNYKIGNSVHYNHHDQYLFEFDALDRDHYQVKFGHQFEEIDYHHLHDFVKYFKDPGQVDPIDPNNNIKSSKNRKD